MMLPKEGGVTVLKAWIEMCTVCPKSPDLFYVVSDNIKWVKTHWTESIPLVSSIDNTPSPKKPALSFHLQNHWRKKQEQKSFFSRYNTHRIFKKE